VAANYDPQNSAGFERSVASGANEAKKSRILIVAPFEAFGARILMRTRILIRIVMPQLDKGMASLMI
jgi:hypothetical protein